MLPIDYQLQLNVIYYVNVASLVILYYDYFLTFSMEVERFWTLPTLTWTSFLFYLNRYVSLFGHIPVALQIFWTTSNMSLKTHICHPIQVYHQVLIVFLQSVIGALLILRTYALYNRNRYVLLILLVTATSTIVVGFWAIHAGASTITTSLVTTNEGCISEFTYSSSLHFGIAWSGMLLFDAIIFLLTMYKSLSTKYNGKYAHHRPLFAILLRDGFLYFSVMLLANLCNILMFFVVVSPPLLRGMPSTFTNAISATMISRLVLRLRDPSLSSGGARTQRPQTTDTDSNYQSPSTVFLPETTVYLSDRGSAEW